MKLKHNKKRNTLFLFETLMYEFTQASLNKDNEYAKDIKKTILSFFNKNTPLYEELQLYKSIVNTTNIKDRRVAEKILFESKLEYIKLNKQQVFSSQTALINRINKNLRPSIFNNPVKNYTSMASAYQIFNNTSDVKTRVLLEEEMLENMCRCEVLNEEKTAN
jgi:hypothetical protein